MKRLLAFSAPLLTAVSLSAAQYTYEQVRSFGVSADSGFFPEGPVMEALDGRLYGTTSSGGLQEAGTLFRVERDGSAYTPIYNFDTVSGQAPVGALAQDADGTLYGVTYVGGVGDSGVLFSLRPDGSQYTVLKAFESTGVGGQHPLAGVLLASDGILYGTAYDGGAFGAGTVFSINRDGTDFRVLHDFGDSSSDGRNPRCIPTELPDGWICGTTEKGGAEGAGSVFRVAKVGGGYQVLKSFAPATEGKSPYAGVIRGSDGRLYGTLFVDRTGTGGAVYALNADGGGFTVIKTFMPSEGIGLAAAVTESTDGLLYAVALFGGAWGDGGVYRFNKDGSGFATVRVFGIQASDPGGASNPVIEASDGKIYVATKTGGANGAGTIVRMAKDGTGFQVVRSFTHLGSDARYLRAQLVTGKDGFLYGTSEAGGKAASGTVFRLKADGSSYSVIRQLGQAPGDPVNPAAGVIQASDDNLYGTSRGGGTAGRGTVFRLAPDGSGFAVLRSFQGGQADGSAPFAGLTEADNGWLYGVTSGGGASNLGTLFRVQKDGSGYAVLRSFTGGSGDASTPAGLLLQASDGLLYGTSFEGGSHNRGTIFRLGLDGSGYAVLRSFTDASLTPSTPYGGLIEGSDGRLYGTSFESNGGGGTVYSLAKDGSGLVTLAKFPTPANGGTAPIGNLVEDAAGLLWGTCSEGGAESRGTVYTLKKDGSAYEIVHAFKGTPTEGMRPAAGLFVSADGIVYGTTTGGGRRNGGSVFRLSPADAVSIQGIAISADGAPTVGVQAVPGWLCRLEAADSLSAPTWAEVATGRADASGQVTIEDRTAAGHALRFYRVQGTPSSVEE